MKTWQFWGFMCILMLMNGNICETQTGQQNSGIIAYVFGLIAIYSYIYSGWNRPTDKS